MPLIPREPPANPAPPRNPQNKRRKRYQGSGPKQTYRYITPTQDKARRIQEQKKKGEDINDVSLPYTLESLTEMASRRGMDRALNQQSVLDVIQSVNSGDKATSRQIAKHYKELKYFVNMYQIQQTVDMVQHLVADLKLTQERNENLIQLIDALQLYIIDVKDIKEEDVLNTRRILVALKSNITQIDTILEKRQKAQGDSIYQKGSVQDYIKLRDAVDRAYKNIFGMGYVHQQREYRRLMNALQNPAQQASDVLNQLTSLNVVDDEQQEQQDATAQVASLQGQTMQALGQAIRQGLVTELPQGQAMQLVGRSIRNRSSQTGDIPDMTAVVAQRVAPVARRNRYQRKKYQRSLTKFNLSDFNQMRSAYSSYVDSQYDDIVISIRDFFTMLPYYIEEGLVPQDLDGLNLSALNSQQIDKLNKQYMKLLKSIYRNRILTQFFDTITRVSLLALKLAKGILATSSQLVGACEFFTSSFQDMFSPINQITSIIGIAVKGVQAQGELLEPMLGVVMGQISLAVSTMSGGKKKKSGKHNIKDNEKQETGHEQIVSAFGAILAVFTAVASLAVSAIMQALNQVLGGINMLSNILSQMMTVLKKIFSTSELMKQILNMVNLAIVMFFLPFFNQFANLLLDAVFRLLLWAVSYNLADKDYMLQPFIDIQTGINNCLQNNLELIKGVIYKCVSELLPMLLEAFVSMLPFVGYFIETIINNTQNITNLLKKGLDVQTQLINNHIIQLFIAFGNACMEFLHRNSNNIKDLFETQCDLMSDALDQVTFIGDYLWQFCIAQGAQIGGYIAVVSVLLLGGESFLFDLALQAIGVGVKSTAVTFIKIFQEGQMGGALIAQELYKYFFSFAEGGYIPSVPGGMLVRVAEKETEYLIPESKMHLIRGHNNLIIDIKGNVYGIDDPRRFIKEAINTQSNKSTFR